MADEVTREQLLRTMPSKLHNNITDEFVDSLNRAVKDPNFRHVYKENLLSYTNVLQDGRFKIQQYVDAVRFVSHKLLGDLDVVAYTKTFRF